MSALQVRVLSALLKIMQILIIGGTGFIGPYVVQQLVHEGHNVTLFHRSPEATAFRVFH